MANEKKKRRKLRRSRYLEKVENVAARLHFSLGKEDNNYTDNVVYKSALIQ